MPDDQTDEEQAIIAVIRAECDAFYRRDFQAMSGFWLQDEAVMRMGTLAGGQVEARQGWEAEAALIQRIMRDHPTPNSGAEPQVRRENMVVRVAGTMAWARFDQFGPPSDDPFVILGLSHQVRVFEKHGGRWLIAFAGYADTRLEYISAPTIRVNADGEILWMNDGARAGLRDHPVLTASNRTLRARTLANDKMLRTALALSADLTPMDLRRSVSTMGGTRGATPLVLTSADDLTPQILWVLQQDGMTLVTFGDDAAETERLTSAQEIYGLSKAQMRMAGLIVAGHDLVKAADHLGVSVNTARTHLQRMFDKTGVRSQTALVRVLLNASGPDI